MPGFLVMDKPAGLTSHDVVGILRAVTGEKRIGHTGTLDPFATGVLAMAIGPSTRLIQYLDESIKVYDATIGLGTATTTGDPEGEPLRTAPVPALTRGQVVDVLSTFVGARNQTPPAYSAVKVKGKPLYAYARAGEVVEAAPRPITVYGMDLLELGADSMRVIIRCSRGTYARVLAEEIAIALGTEGHLTALSRRQSGPFLLDGALDMPTLAAIVAGEELRDDWQKVFRSGKSPEPRVPWRHRDEVRQALKPMIWSPIRALGHLPLLDVNEDGARKVRRGAAPAALPAGVKPGGRYLIALADELVAIAEVSPRGPHLLCVMGDG